VKTVNSFRSLSDERKRAITRAAIADMVGDGELTEISQPGTPEGERTALAENYIRFANDRYWRKAAIPNIGCVRCGTCDKIEMISRF